MLCLSNPQEHGPIDIRRQNELLVLLRQEMVRCLVYQYGADETDANDATQETMYVLLRLYSQKKVNGVKTQKAYVFAVLKYQYFKLLRDRVRMTGEPIEYYENTLVVKDSETLADREARDLLHACIGKLTQKHQNYLSYWMDSDNPSATEFSECFGVSVTNAWTIKHRLIAILEKCVGKQYKTLDNSGY
jgi:RNA polymerase sigma factor (sigma-70 family)